MTTAEDRLRAALPLPRGERAGVRGNSGTVLARKLRRRATDAEALLWQKLRSRQLNGIKFKRQVPIGGYFADFASLEHHVIVEVDGSQHLDADGIARDAERTRVLETLGYVVLRFLNTDVLTNADGVALVILDAINNLGPVPPHPNPLPTGERGPASRSRGGA